MSALAMLCQRCVVVDHRRHVSVVQRGCGTEYEVTVTGHEMRVLQKTEVGPYFAGFGEGAFDLMQQVHFQNAFGRNYVGQIREFLGPSWGPAE